jgi:alpha-ketoglutaric semialdehyde dehydrogenase
VTSDSTRILQNYVNGRWVDSASGRRSRCVNPAHREATVCEAQASGPQDVEQAVAAATEAFPDWAQMPAPRRAALLQEVWFRMKSREEDFVRTITRENGKTLRESRAEFHAALKEADFQIGQGRRIAGKHLPSEVPGVACYLRRRPLGVAALITPWNFPLNVACRKLFPALIAGNCCVLKPSDLTPMSAALLFELLHESGLPPGVANLVTGRGSVIGDTLVTHPAVQAVSFTGSTEVGVGIAQKLAGRATKVQLEMGGKNPLVVLADADLPKAVEAAVVGAYSCSGQWCTSTSRLIVEQAVYAPFLEQLVAAVNALTVGDGFDETTRMGPVCGTEQFDNILRYLELGKREGTRLCAGGRALTEGRLALGCFIAPTVFADVTPAMRIAREEIFGPVLVVMPAKDFDEALQLANATPFGLASSIYTTDLAKARRFVAESEVGLCHVNLTTAWKEPQLEFGGVKESGRGLPEAGESGLEFFTAHQAVYVKERA